MSQWTGKFVIGLTGNIATGKSVVRKMLEHLGAYGIDADALAHRVIVKGAPGYQPVLQAFGQWILDVNGEIDRGKLGKIVFSNPAALKQLESIVHPYVIQVVDLLARRATQKVVVIEAIKLIESTMFKTCDSVWVTYAPPEVQLARLMGNRRMSEAEAKQRIQAQPPQEEKINAASIVVHNDGTYEETWQQVNTAWNRLFKPANSTPSTAKLPQAQPEELPSTAKLPQKGELSVLRGRPKDASKILDFINRLNPGEPRRTQDDIMAAFGEKAFLLCKAGDNLAGLVSWQVENLIARTSDIQVDPGASFEQVTGALLREVEKASGELQCEVSLLFIPQVLSHQQPIWGKMGYESSTPEALGVLAWQEAANDSMPAKTTLYFKQLRQDRVLRPI